MLSDETMTRLAGHQVCAAVSGGKDSTAMSLWLTEQGIEHLRVFADTGANLRNDRRDALSKLLRDIDLSALKVNANGSPAHPLYQRSDLLPQRFILKGLDV